MKTISVSKENILKSMLFCVSGVCSCIILPQFFHLLGYASGLGTSLGAAFLPMHLAVIFIGLFFGKGIGLVCGLVSPVVSYYLTGMPLLIKVPLMTVELAAYGYFAGVLSNKSVPTLLKVFIVQLAGRLAKTVAILLLMYVFNTNAGSPMGVWTSAISGLPGIVLQLTLLPLVLFKLGNKNV